MAKLEDAFCTPATFTPSTKKPATASGCRPVPCIPAAAAPSGRPAAGARPLIQSEPAAACRLQFTGHSFALSFSTGSCYFNETAFEGALGAGLPSQPRTLLCLAQPLLPVRWRHCTAPYSPLCARSAEEGTKQLTCIEPAITYVAEPANFTSAYHAAPKFTAK